jgi:hypothetical protein
MTQSLAEQEVLTPEERADELTKLLARLRARSQEGGEAAENPGLRSKHFVFLF